MIRLKLTKTIVSLLLGVSILILVPIGASADTWKQDQGGKWYLLDDNGNYKNGWVQDGSNWYHISITRMDTNRYVDGYYLGDNGAWTESPTWNITDYGKVITPESVKATLDMYNKLLNEGWVKDNRPWYNNVACVYPKERADGGHYSTECYIDSGIATIKYVTSCQNYDEWNKPYSKSKYVDLTLDQYLKYKSEGKIGTFTFYAGTGGNMNMVVQEYIKNGDSVTTSL